MDFSEALRLLKHGQRVARSGWNGKGMWLQRVLTGEGTISRLPRPFTSLGDDEVPIEQFIIMKTADNKFVPWLASQTDILADDWDIVNYAASDTE